jgi:hypothetical protein
MGRYINENGYICYTRGQTPYSAAHGWQEVNYCEEERLVNEVVNEKMKALTTAFETAIPQAIEEYGRTVWAQLITKLVGALQTDIESQVSVGFDGLREVFYGEKCQKYISDNIMKTMLKELDKIKHVKIKL